MTWRTAWGPVVPRPTGLDWLRTVGGAAFGLALATLVVLLDARYAPHLPLHLFAPLGATAVLVFAVPTSPLAQPFSCVAGNTLSAAWTLLVLHALPPALTPDAWPAVAVAGAIGLMLLTRSLHPPGGAVALLIALTPEQSLATPWPLFLLQFGLMTAVLVMAGALYHRSTGRRYPHHTDPAPAQTGAHHGSRLGLSTADLEGLLQRFDLANNLDAQDLAEVLAAAEDEAIEHRLGGVNCAQLMSPHPVSCRSDETLAAVAERFVGHSIKSLPVLSADGLLMGFVARSALFERLWQHGGAQAQADAPEPERGGVLRLRWLKPVPKTEQRQRTVRAQRAGRAAQRLVNETLAQHPELLQVPELRVSPDTPVGQLLEALASHPVPCVPVLEGEHLVGLITRTDLMRVLLQPEPQAGPVGAARPVA